MLMNKVSIIEEPSGYDLDYQNSGIIILKCMYSINVIPTSKRYPMECQRN